MKKALGLAIALTLALSGFVAAAEQTNGTIRMIDSTDHSIVLQDGTRLWVTEGQFADLSLGDQVQAAYEMNGDKKFVTQMDRYLGLDGSRNPVDSIQAGGDE